MIHAGEVSVEAARLALKRLPSSTEQWGGDSMREWMLERVEQAKNGEIVESFLVIPSEWLGSARWQFPRIKRLELRTSALGEMQERAAVVPAGGQRYGGRVLRSLAGEAGTFRTVQRFLTARGISDLNGK